MGSFEQFATAALADEERRLRRLRVMADLTAAVIRQRPLSRTEAEHLVDQLRREVLNLFPGTEAVFDLIYRPRFARLIDECSRFQTPGGRW